MEYDRDPTGGSQRAGGRIVQCVCGQAPRPAATSLSLQSTDGPFVFSGCVASRSSHGKHSPLLFSSKAMNMFPIALCFFYSKMFDRSCDWFPLKTVMEIAVAWPVKSRRRFCFFLPLSASARKRQGNEIPAQANNRFSRFEVDIWTIKYEIKKSRIYLNNPMTKWRVLVSCRWISFRQTILSYDLILEVLYPECKQSFG
jgi:hypothetical protein